MTKNLHSGYFASGVSVNINQHTGWPWTSYWNHSTLGLLHRQGKSSGNILRVTTHTHKVWLRMIGGTELQIEMFISEKADALGWAPWKQSLRQGEECGLQSTPGRKLWGTHGPTRLVSSHRKGVGHFCPNACQLLAEVCEQAGWRREWCHLFGEGVLVCFGTILSRRGRQNFFSNTHIHWIGKEAP